MKAKPNLVKTEQIDDIQSVSQSIDEYYDKFVRPIDNYRSISNAPGLSTNSSNTTQRLSSSVADNNIEKTLSGLQVSPTRFIESRCHCFYRMVGFPVASDDGFYNSGHDPNQISNIGGRDAIDTSFSSKHPDLINLITIREVSAQSRRNIFAAQNDLSTIYSLLVRHLKPFLMQDEGLAPFQYDPQTKTINSRSDEIDNLASDTVNKSNEHNPTKLTVPSICTTVSHILKPFVVSSDIERSVTPSWKNRICVPFLPSQKDTQTLENQTLKRPILEFIIRQRLQATDISQDFKNQVQYVLDNKKNQTDTSLNDIKDTLLILSGDTNIDNVSNDILSSVGGFTQIQVATINMFTKAIKSCLKQLDLSIRELDLISSQISLQPIPNVEGLEFGGSIRTDVELKQPSETDKNIALMNLIQINNDFNSKVDTSKIGGGNDLFATAIVADLGKNFDNSIQNNQRARDELGSQAMKHLRNIEIVTGEISGLGLIDILAVYCALWIIDLDTLLGFLDSNSLNRLQAYFPELVNVQVFNQIGNRPPIIKTLTKFESTLFNILSFSDKYFDKLRRTQMEARGSSIR